MYIMLKYLYQLIWAEETNSLCPNSFSPMPRGKFHNFAIIRIEPDEPNDEEKKEIII